MTRDRLVWMVYVQIALYAFFLYSFGVTVHLLRDELGVSRTLGGLHGTAFAGGVILAGITGRRAAVRLGRRRLLWLGLAVLCVAMTGYCASTALPFTLFFAFVCGTSGSYVVNVGNAGLIDSAGPHGPSVISEANALAAVAGFVATVAIGAFEGLGVGWRAGMLLVLPLSVVAAVAFRHVDVPPPVRADPGTVPAVGGSLLPRQYWITWGVLVCSIAAEFCLSLWATDLLSSRDRLSAAAATEVWSGLLLGVGLSRWVGGRLSRRYPLDLVLAGALLTLLVGFTVFWVATSTWLAVTGLVIAGLGLGMQYPLAVSRAIMAAPGHSDLASARTSLAAGLAVGGGPFLLGALADRYGTHTAFLLVPVLILLGLLGLAVSRPPAPGPPATLPAAA